MDRERSYYALYRGDIVKALQENNINRYIILNEQLISIYVDDDFDESILTNMPEITWWNQSQVMSSLIQTTNSLKLGETINFAVGTDYIKNNPYINVTGKDILIAIIDSGVDYLHPDLITRDGKSKIAYLWDQENNSGTPPEGMIFGSEFNNEQINEAIRSNNPNLSKDNIGTGTAVAGILVGQGNINNDYSGIAKDAELVVIKLREYDGVYKEGRISYGATDFFAAITYAVSIAEKENKPMIINLTIGSRSSTEVETTIIETYSVFNRPGMIIVSGAGDQGNTDIHYSGNIKQTDAYQDVILQNGENKNLDITISGNGPDKLDILLISPSGELSQTIQYAPSYNIYEGKFNLENTSYKIRYTYPWIDTGELRIEIRLTDISPGIWTIRLIPELILSGNYDIYLPNKNLISENTRFLDPNSMGTITMYANSESIITVGAFNGRLNSIWIGSSNGDSNGFRIKPDIIAPGVNIISTYINGGYNTFTGTGISSTITAGVLALIMEYLIEQSNIPKLSLFNEVLKTYLMLGTTRKEIYTYPNLSEGYGLLNLESLFMTIANNL